MQRARAACYKEAGKMEFVFVAFVLIWLFQLTFPVDAVLPSYLPALTPDVHAESILIAMLEYYVAINRIIFESSELVLDVLPR